MGGLLIRLGQTSQLYPIPNPKSLDNPGMNPASAPKPGYWEIEQRYGVPDITHWMLPPASALPFVPLSFLPFKQAEWVWAFVLIGCVWGIALLSAQFHRLLVGRETGWEGFIALLVVLSPVAARAIRIRNTSAPIGLCFALLAFGLLRDDRTRRAVGAALLVVLGVLLKYATAVLLPLLIATRRWRTLGWTAAIGLATVVISLIAMDPYLWREYFTQIAPKLHWPSGFPGNQTLPGFILRTTGQKPFAPATALLLYGSQAVTLLGIVGLMARVPRDGWREPANVCAAVAALVAWLLAFSPCAWEHWPIWLAPFWGWMLWEAQRSAPRAVVAILALGLMYVPLSIFTNPGFFRADLRVPEPWNSSQLAGVLLTMGLGAARLMQGRTRAAEVRPSPATEHPLPVIGARAAGRGVPVGA
jgi:alpha-1,2-mannosyltransferase